MSFPTVKAHLSNYLSSSSLELLQEYLPYAFPHIPLLRCTVVRLELNPSRKIIAGSLGEDRENKGFLSTTVFTFRTQGQAERCPTFFFFFLTELLKTILHFYYHF